MYHVVVARVGDGGGEGPHPIRVAAPPLSSHRGGPCHSMENVSALVG